MSIGSSLFFAGGEVDRITQDLVECGARNILYSFFHLWDLKRTGTVHRWTERHPEFNWFLDSGAFTYAQRAERGESLPNVDEYLHLFYMFIDELGERFCRIAEPDLDIAGYSIEQVDEWREVMLSNWPHLNITPVWHADRGKKRWRDYLDDPRIRTLAMGSGDIIENTGRTRRMLMLAKEAGKPVHGFGVTRVNTILKSLPFDSIDSSSWLLGQQVGATFVFRANTFKRYSSDEKKKRLALKSYFRNIGCDPKKIIEDDSTEVRRANIKAWAMLGDRMEAYKRHSHGQVEHAIVTPPRPGYDPKARRRPLPTTWRK